MTTVPIVKENVEFNYTLEELLKLAEGKYEGTDRVQRARERIGENLYSVFSNNCEHFVNWCIGGHHESGQVDKGIVVGSAAIPAVVGTSSNVLAATTGAVAGASGSGIMSGLATIGSVVGGGMAAGVCIVGGSGAAAVSNYG